MENAEEQELCTTEAQAAMEELKKISGVKQVEIANNLPFTQVQAYLNIITIEDKTMCVEVCPSGWRKVSDKFGQVSIDKPVSCTDVETMYYETINCLLSAHSDAFKTKFAEALTESLTKIAQEENQ
ncbi:hypothetical protein Ciccas_003916 [Cichlidogyrus casuarinus]|uniref:GSKIP domain-containing protein n=1 Tax=Cichlidogyrus casuarinus TaxID=1844966 RepID=A0ABD2QF92_9PLAT